MTASLAFIAGFGRLALAAPAPPVDENQMQGWSNWWMNEIERQYHSKPRWVADYRIPETSPMELASTDGPIKVMATFKVNDAYDPDLLIMWHLGLLNTEAFIPPSKTPPVYIGGDRGAGAFWHHIPYDLAELWGVCPRLDHRQGFPWRRNIRAFSSIASTSFCTAQFEEANPFKLNIPKRLSVYGDDLRLFEDSVNRMLKDPSLLLLDQGGMSWTMLFFRWSPPEQDEMFSTLLPHSP